MGCKSSKVSVLNDANETWVGSVDLNKKPRSGKKSGKRNVFLVQEAKGEAKRSGSDSSLDGELEGPTRGVGSATSKVSSRTFDSGLGEDYSHVITETSDPERLRLAEERPHTPDFMLSGHQLQVRQRSGKKRDTASILEELQQQGLLSSASERPKSRGVAFDVMLSGDEGLAPIMRAPPRLAKLKKRHKKKKPVTKEALEAKLKAAEERRKAREQEMKEKLQAQLNRDKQVQDAMNSFEESQKKAAEEAIDEKIDRAAEKREAQIQAMKEKMQKKKEHAERVRQLKLQRQAEAAARGDNNELENEQIGENQTDFPGENQTDLPGAV